MMHKTSSLSSTTLVCDQDEQNTTYPTNGLPTLFAVDYPIPAGYVQGIEKDPGSRLEADAMFPPIAVVLLLVPRKILSYIR
jgi:hypothetical protein